MRCQCVALTHAGIRIHYADTIDPRHAQDKCTEPAIGYFDRNLMYALWLCERCHALFVDPSEGWRWVPMNSLEAWRAAHC
jgi:hypothetical protein